MTHRADDTSMGGRRGDLPDTRCSEIQRILSAEPFEREEAFGALVAAYWKPVYKSIRIRWNKSNEDAKDLTQEFFVRVLEKDSLRSFDPAKGRFRTFLMVCLQRFLSNEHAAAGRLKRGGGVTFVPIPFEDAEEELRARPASAPEDLEATFEREWVRHLFGCALDRLRTELIERDKEVQFRLFERWDLRAGADDPNGYDALEAEFGLTRNQIGNTLSACRRRLREIVLQQLRAITASEEEYREEVRTVLGAESA